MSRIVQGWSVACSTLRKVALAGGEFAGSTPASIKAASAQWSSL
jgi:hypothetical protein